MQRPWPAMLLVVLLGAVILSGSLAGAERAIAAGQGGAAPPQTLGGEPVFRAAAGAPVGSLSDCLKSAAETLLRHGLPDPRGRRYCSVKLDAGVGRRGTRETVAAHAWVRSADPVQGARTAVAWNGLVYPVIEVGGPADLRADVLAAVRRQEDARRAAAKNQPEWNFQVEEVNPLVSTASGELPHPLGACLLLHLGEPDLAETVWWASDRTSRFDPSDASEDPYLVLVDDWTWVLFHRALYCHMNAEDRGALEAASRLISIWEAAETKTRRRGDPLPDRAPLPHREPPYVKETAAIRELYADQQRRAAEKQAGKAPPVRAAGGDPDARYAELKRTLEACPDSAGRITLLVQQLEEVRASESEWDGDHDFTSDHVIRLLIETDESAVEPLLSCLEHDARLTRTVRFDRRPSGDRRELVSVGEAAYEALAAILQKDFVGPAVNREDWIKRGQPFRDALVRRIRDYFDKYRGLSAEERWYRILLDDRAPMSWWIEAADQIVRTSKRRSIIESLLVDDEVLEELANRDKVGRMAGETLRSKKGPTVSEILGQRARELPLDIGSQVGVVLAFWDGPASIPVLRDLTAKVLASVTPSTQWTYLWGAVERPAGAGRFPRAGGAAPGRPSADGPGGNDRRPHHRRRDQ